MGAPLVSVVIVVCNFEHYLGEAIESIVKQSWILDRQTDQSRLPLVSLLPIAGSGFTKFRIAAW
jgi:hypothetical protein